MTQSVPAQEAPPEDRGGRYMTIIEHLEELRRRLFVSAITVVIGLAISAFFGDRILEFLKEPAEERNPNFSLQFIEPFELIVTYFRVALLGGLIFAMPMLIYQMLMFVSPALTPREKRWVYGTVFGAFVFFLGGMAFCYYVALPPALDFLLDFGNDIATPNIRVGSYVDFVTRLIFWTGVTFETPMVVMYLARFRILSSGQALRFWRYAVVVAFIIAAIVTPTIDPVTQSLVAGPIVVLYFLGIGLAWLVEPKGDEAAR
ncbi:MAG TPA: twin-arginine translocase subunit TatC [Dehalococcoidia bacterium]|nr:twin-arginine translocase subunit TatC [Dehalococcoidia bacterium]